MSRWDHLDRLFGRGRREAVPPPPERTPEQIQRENQVAYELEAAKGQMVRLIRTDGCQVWGTVQSVGYPSDPEPGQSQLPPPIASILLSGHDRQRVVSLHNIPVDEILFVQPFPAARPDQWPPDFVAKRSPSAGGQFENGWQLHGKDAEGQIVLKKPYPEGNTGYRDFSSAEFESMNSGVWAKDIPPKGQVDPARLARFEPVEPPASQRNDPGFEDAPEEHVSIPGLERRAEALSATEFRQLVVDVTALLRAEQEAGRGYLDGRRTLQEVRGKGEYLRDGDTVVLPNHGEVLVVGDLHGSVGAWETILKREHVAERLAAGEDLQLMVLGDMVDRDERDVELLQSLLSLKRAYPRNVTLLRGDHETDYVKPDFTVRIRDSYGPTQLEEVRALFDSLPYIAVDPRGEVYAHGGPAEGLATLTDLAHLSDLQKVVTMWSDAGDHPEPFALARQRLPKHAVKRLRDDPSPATVAALETQYPTLRSFNQAALEQFLTSLGASRLIRGHEHHDSGTMAWDRRLITITTALHYSQHQIGPLIFGRIHPTDGQSQIEQLNSTSTYREHITRRGLPFWTKSAAATPAPPVRPGPEKAVQLDGMAEPPLPAPETDELELARFKTAVATVVPGSHGSDEELRAIVRNFKLKERTDPLGETLKEQFRALVAADRAALEAQQAAVEGQLTTSEPLAPRPGSEITPAPPAVEAPPTLKVGGETPGAEQEAFLKERDETVSDIRMEISALGARMERMRFSFQALISDDGIEVEDAVSAPFRKNLTELREGLGRLELKTENLESVTAQKELEEQVSDLRMEISALGARMERMRFSFQALASDLFKDEAGDDEEPVVERAELSPEQQGEGELYDLLERLPADDPEAQDAILLAAFEKRGKIIEEHKTDPDHPAFRRAMAFLETAERVLEESDAQPDILDDPQLGYL